jgi:hypothetical protein
VLNLAGKAGADIAKNGCIDNEIIEGIIKVDFVKEDFRKMSNMSCDMCIKENKTLAEMQAEWIRRGSREDTLRIGSVRVDLPQGYFRRSPASRG